MDDAYLTKQVEATINHYDYKKAFPEPTQQEIDFMCDELWQEERNKHDRD